MDSVCGHAKVFTVPLNAKPGDTLEFASEDRLIPAPGWFESDGPVDGKWRYTTIMPPEGDELGVLFWLHTGDAIHDWFGLSYAQYLVVPRSALQSMGSSWQRKFVALLEELDETIDWRPKDGLCYYVVLRDDSGKMVSLDNDPLMDYERGRRRVPHREGVAGA